jgi:hypothetical protein
MPGRLRSVLPPRKTSVDVPELNQKLVARTEYRPLLVLIISIPIPNHRCYPIIPEYYWGQRKNTVSMLAVLLQFLFHLLRS